MVTETEFGNRVGIFASKIRVRLSVKNLNRENREIETEIKFGNPVGIFACKIRSRLSQKSARIFAR